MDVEIPPETTTDFLIRVGLYIGAIFQLTCIFAIIILPDKKNDTMQKKNHADISDQEHWDSSPANPPRNFQHKTRKQDKKKRR
ncbi:unnamed protein product [Nezara viridula]|uniref:Protein anon-73B1 n=1 Tax=Nezara viridula TaxID=85310 RepID=A0A9P0ED09_NEZVI|nr:unnamed protein product [Nezara viridula]